MKLPNVLDFAAAAGLHQSDIGRSEGRPGVCRSMHLAVELISLPCMQVILAATREGADDRQSVAGFHGSIRNTGARSGDR